MLSVRRDCQCGLDEPSQLRVVQAGVLTGSPGFSTTARRLTRDAISLVAIFRGITVLELPSLTIVALLLAVTLAAAQPACLPASVFVKNANEEFPVIELGYIDNVLTLCVHQRALEPTVDKLLGCWTVNSTTAALGASTATAIPGRGRRNNLDAQNCINGYCIAPISADDNRPFVATSTDGAHAAILTEHFLYIFATSTKAKVAEIELMKEGAPDDTNEGNVPWGLLYSGDTLFVIGNTAGPFTDALVFKEDGSRAGGVRTGVDPINIFKGGYGILGRDKVALADAGLQNMTIVTAANVAKKTTKRTTSYAPCTKHQFDQWAETLAACLYGKPLENDTLETRMDVESANVDFAHTIIS
jgi:hypothetical protein